MESSLPEQYFTIALKKFHATFQFDLDLLQAYNNLDTGQNAKGSSFVILYLAFLTSVLSYCMPEECSMKF